jgi:hypothetical protein
MNASGLGRLPFHPGAVFLLEPTACPEVIGVSTTGDRATDRRATERRNPVGHGTAAMSAGLIHFSACFSRNALRGLPVSRGERWASSGITPTPPSRPATTRSQTRPPPALRCVHLASRRSFVHASNFGPSDHPPAGRGGISSTKGSHPESGGGVTLEGVRGDCPRGCTPRPPSTRSHCHVVPPTQVEILDEE